MSSEKHVTRVVVKQTTRHRLTSLLPASFMGAVVASSCIATPSSVFDDSLPAPQPEPTTALHVLQGLVHRQVISHAPRTTRTTLTCRLTG